MNGSWSSLPTVHDVSCADKKREASHIYWTDNAHGSSCFKSNQKKEEPRLRRLSLRPWSPMLYVNRYDTKFINFQGWLGLQMMNRHCSPVARNCNTKAIRALRLVSIKSFVHCQGNGSTLLTLLKWTVSSLRCTVKENVNSLWSWWINFAELFSLISTS